MKNEKMEREEKPSISIDTLELIRCSVKRKYQMDVYNAIFDEIMRDRERRK